MASDQDRTRVLFAEVALPGSNSAIHRCDPIARELDRHGFKCEIAYRPNIATIISKGLKSRVIIFRRYTYPWAFLLAGIFRCFRKLVVLDVDDAVFTPMSGTGGRWFYAPILWMSTVLMALSSSAVVVGSHFLKEFAVRFNRRVFLVPTPVDVELFHPGAPAGKAVPVLGSFASSDSHAEFLKLVKEPLIRLHKEVPFRLKLLGAERFPRTRALFADAPFPVDVTPWLDLNRIPEHVAGFDVNLYPLTDDDWSRGKCSLRILEAMCLGIPSVASRVGENPHVIDEGKDGLLAATPDEWVEKLRLLMDNPQLRQEMGQRGREKVLRDYSQAVIGGQYASLLKRCLK